MRNEIPKHIKEKFICLEAMLSPKQKNKIDRTAELLHQWQKLEKKTGLTVKINGSATREWLRDLYFEAKGHLNAM